MIWEYLFSKGSTYFLDQKYWGSTFRLGNKYWGSTFSRGVLLGCYTGILPLRFSHALMFTAKSRS